ncbi:MAG: hypothetical protein P8X90_03725 [Desulfobacterales bacterium]
MTISVPIHEIISWLVTVVAVTMYLMERRKNVTAPCYTALQGILRSCLERKGHFALLAKNLQEDEREEIPKTEFLLTLEIAQTEYFAMMQYVMGTIQAIRLNQDIPLEVDEFSMPEEDL